MKDVVPKVKMIMKQASVEAKQLDSITLSPEHILLSILNDDDNEGVRVLRKLNIDSLELYDKLADFVRKTDLTPRLGNTFLKNLPYSIETNAVVKEVDNQCNIINDKNVDIIHIILALLSKSSQATQFLNTYGITYDLFKETLLKMRNSIKNGSNIDDDNTIEEPDTSSNTSNKKVKKPASKTPVLDNFCIDLSKAATKGELDPVVGRVKEIKRVAQILSRRKKHNPILVGLAGSGKTSIADGLAMLITSGNAPRTLANKKIYSLDLTSIVAGTKYRGQFEERMKLILAECKANPDIILFIDEIHTIIGTGNSSGSLDVANIIKPALSRGELQVIGATTLEEYREHIEKDAALTRRFQYVLVEEPNIEETTIILNNIKFKYENYHKVIYSPEAINECIKLANRYVTDRAMPDKAIDILDEAGAMTNIGVEKPNSIKKLEDKLTTIQETKRNIVNQQLFEEAAKLRDDEADIKNQLELANVEWNASLLKNQTLITPEIISEVVSIMTGIPVNKMSTQETKKLVSMEKDLLDKIIGQDEAVRKVVKAIRRSRVGLRDKSKPIGVYICLGSTGTGKSLLAKLLAEHVFDDKEALVRIDMSEYSEKFNVSRLIGSPPGYVGYEQGGQLTEKIRRKPHSVILLDEIEKAHPDVYDLLLQVFDDGHLTDGLGRKINFKNTLIILTSNIGARDLANAGNSVGFQTNSSVLNDEIKKKSIIEKALKKNFKPEFLNRVDDVIVFNSLTIDDMHKIIKNEIKKLENRIGEIGYSLNINDDAMDFLVKEGYDKEYGARPLDRAIQKYIEDIIADDILNGNIKDGATLTIGMNEDKTMTKLI